MAVCDSGWIQLYCADNQQEVDTAIQAFRIAETLELPVMVCVDGFTLTHTLEPLDIPEPAQVDAFLPPYRFSRTLDAYHPITLGTLVSPDAYTEVRYAHRVCHHPCERACNRGAFDDPIAIYALERFLGDQALANDWPYPVSAPPPSASEIAVVGAEPAGLSCAYHLLRLGYRVKVFDALPEAGGTLRLALPPYRLPRAVLDAGIGRLLSLGALCRIQMLQNRTGCQPSRARSNKPKRKR